jgi:regulator of nucleoside diphosphate kinase
VLPGQADVSRLRISVLAPIGAALLGYREGDQVEWPVPGGLRRLRIKRVTRPTVSAVGEGG